MINNLIMFVGYGIGKLYPNHTLILYVWITELSNSPLSPRPVPVGERCTATS